MNTLLLALRNLLRNRRRSIATLVAMIIGSACLLLFGGYIRNIVYGLQTGYVRGGGHLQLHRRGYDVYGSGDPTAYGIPDYAAVIDVVRNDAVLAPLLTVVTPTLEFGGIAGNFEAGVSRTVMVIGTVADDQNVLQRWNDYGFPGAPEVSPLTGTAPDAVVIGTGVARVLLLCRPLHLADCPPPRAAQADGAALPGDVSALVAGAASETLPGSGGPELELLAATTGGAPNVARLKVLEAETQGVKELDDVYVSLQLPQAQRLLSGAGRPEVTAIVIQLRRTADIPAARARLQVLLQGALRTRDLTVDDFRTLNPYYGQTLGLFDSIFSFMAVLIGSIVLFTVGNTLNAAVVERTVEIGTLRAIGLRRGGIRALFVAEGLLLGGGGAALGVAAALLLTAGVNHSGLQWTPPGSVSPIALHIRLWGESHLLWGIALGLVCIATLSAWWPARRAARLQVVEALRHV